jgi:ribonuclease R
MEVKFNLNENNDPIGVYFKISKDSNHLIEEFMLLANKKVSEFVSLTRKGEKQEILLSIEFTMIQIQLNY